MEGINCTLPDGNKVISTFKCTLDIPGLPQEAQRGHIIPGLASHSLMSVVTLCNAGCNVIFNKTGVRVTYNGRVIMTRRKYEWIGLWTVPLNPLSNPIVTLTLEPTTPNLEASNRPTKN